MIPVTLIFILFNILLAKHDADKIARKETISHRYNAMEYAGLMAFIVPFTYHYFDVIDYVYTAISVILARFVFFNIWLNLFRKKSWDYLSLDTEIDKSEIDAITNKLFGYNGKREYLCYISLFIINLVLYICFT